jgi:hypothetical protein
MRLVLENVSKRVGAEHYLDRLSATLIPRAGNLVCPQLHRQGICDGEGVR